MKKIRRTISNRTEAEALLLGGFNPASTHIFNKETIDSIEANARQCAQNLAQLTDTLRVSLHSMSAISVQNLEVYRTSADNLRDSVLLGVTSMNSLIVKTKQIQDDLKPIEVIANQMYLAVMMLIVKILSLSF